MIALNEPQVVCIGGKNEIAINGAEYLKSKYSDLTLLGIANNGDVGIDDWQPSFVKWCNENSVQIVELTYLYSIKNLIFISLEFDKIVKPALFRSDARLFNIHFSLLPKYKGMATSTLPILHGESKTGVTFHEIDAGIDTGPIIAQEEISIEISDTARSLYFKYMAKGREIFQKHIGKILAKELTAQSQCAIGSSYYSKRDVNYNELSINFNKTAFEISCFIRAFTFVEYQLVRAFKKEIFEVHILTARSKGRPGTIVAQDVDYIDVATVDYDVRLILNANS